MNDSIFNGRVGLVTGGAGHIGAAVCRGLAKGGADVLVLDKDEGAASLLAETLQAEYRIRAESIDCDLLDETALESIGNKVQGAFGRLDFLVNNAAFYDDMPGWGVPFAEEGYAAWLKVMQVNLLAPFFLAQQLHPLLRASDQASVVNVSSIYGLVGPDSSLYEGTDMTNPCAYGASKAGLLQVTRWLATQIGPEVRVNAVTPGGVARGQDEQFVQRYKRKTPLGRMATEPEVADCILFLLSPESRYVTGHNLVVDGGWTAW